MLTKEPGGWHPIHVTHTLQDSAQTHLVCCVLAVVAHAAAVNAASAAGPQAAWYAGGAMQVVNVRRQVQQAVRPTAGLQCMHNHAHTVGT